MTIIIGLDLAKHVFQVHGVDAAGKAVLPKRLRRSEVTRFFADLDPCLIGIEACGSGHHWARELRRFGHDVRLMPPQYVRPYVKTNKHEAADAEAICEAVQRPNMRFVPIKEAAQQAGLMLHRARAPHPAAHDAGECRSRPCRRVRSHRSQGHSAPCGIAYLDRAS